MNFRLDFRYILKAISSKGAFCLELYKSLAAMSTFALSSRFVVA